MRNKIFTLIIFGLFILGICTLLFEHKENTALERRSLNTIDNIRIDNLAESTNEVISDQILFRDQSIIAVNRIRKISNSIFNHKLLRINDNLIELEDDYCIHDYYSLSKQDEATALNRAYNIQQISEKYPDIKTYVYFPTRIEETGLLDMNGIESVYPDLKEKFIYQLGDKVKVSSLQINTIEDYKKYYYKTDHHWNGYGIYKGYCDIVDLINQDFDIDEPKDVEIEESEYDFYGSYAQKMAFLCSPEHLIHIDSEVTGYEYSVNGELTDDNQSVENFIKYGNSDQLLTGYELAYGFNEYEKIYDFNNPDKPNIMIFTDSMFNPLKKLLSSHFNKTVIIDMRSDEGKFSLEDYVNNYDIDIILFLQHYEDLYFNGYLFVPLN